MHTATQMHSSLFGCQVEGRPAGAGEILPGWTASDRLGVVVQEPFGAVGATHLIQLAIASFYDSRPERRDTSRIGPHGESLAVYPDVYLFHVGAPWGDHSGFDVFPRRKEVLVGADPQDVLEALLDRAVTWLAVPEREPLETGFFYTDAAEYYDRVRGAYVYSPTGQVADADVTVIGSRELADGDARAVLDPDGVLEMLSTEENLPTSGDPRLRARDYDVLVRQRAHEARHGLSTAVARRDAITKDGIVTESYRRIPVETALWMLGDPA
jgi:hypothetical protein